MHTHMKRTLSILLALLAAGAVTSAREVTKAALGETKYEVRYTQGILNTKVADATISLENDQLDGKAVLHARASIRAISIFRLFMNAEYLADAYLTPGSHEPVYYINPIKKGGLEGKFECTYDKASGTITTLVVRPPAAPEQQTLSLDGRTMDLLSLLVYIRFTDIPDGSYRAMHLLMGGKSVAATLTCEGGDTERFPGIGAKRFHVKMKDRGLMENGSGNEITVWCSSGSDCRILGLETVLSSSGTMSVSVRK